MAIKHPLRVIEDTAILAEGDTLDRVGTIMFKSCEIFPLLVGDSLALRSNNS